MSPSRGQKNRAVTEHSPMVSGLDADKKTLPSELHGKGRMLAPAVVDAVEDVDVALYAPQLLFRLTRRVNKLGLVGAETVNEPLPVVLAVVQLHEMDDSLNDFRSQGIGIAASCLQQEGQRFLINLCADTLELRKGGIDADDATRAAAPLKAHMQPRFLGGVIELARRLILAAKIGAELCTGRQGCGVAGLHGKQQSFLSLCHTVVHLAEDRQVVVAVHVLARHNSMLPVKHIIVTVTKANLRFVGDRFQQKTMLGFYENELTNRILSFWLPRCLDRQYGGYFNCYNNEGTRRVSTDKYTWSQGRFVWMYSKLALLRSDLFPDAQRERFLRLAQSGVVFLRSHCLMGSDDWRCVFLMDRTGAPKQVGDWPDLDMSMQDMKNLLRDE